MEINSCQWTPLHGLDTCGRAVVPQWRTDACCASRVLLGTVTPPPERDGPPPSRQQGGVGRRVAGSEGASGSAAGERRVAWQLLLADGAVLAKPGRAVQVRAGGGGAGVAAVLRVGQGLPCWHRLGNSCIPCSHPAPCPVPWCTAAVHSQRRHAAHCAQP